MTFVSSDTEKEFYTATYEVDVENGFYSTYITSSSIFPPGEYLVSIVVEGEVLETTTFVILEAE